MTIIFISIVFLPLLSFYGKNHTFDFHFQIALLLICSSLYCQNILGRRYRIRVTTAAKKKIRINCFTDDIVSIIVGCTFHRDLK